MTDQNTFSDPQKEARINEQLNLFCSKIRQLAIENDYPFIAYELVKAFDGIKLEVQKPKDARVGYSLRQNSFPDMASCSTNLDIPASDWEEIYALVNRVLQSSVKSPDKHGLSEDEITESA